MPVITSPFRKTVGFVRINDYRPERLELLKRYEPFFGITHYSMPGLIPGEPELAHNLTHDQYESAYNPPNEPLFKMTFTIYMQVANTMALILEQAGDIDGLLFYHFDAWISPLDLANRINLENIQFADFTDPDQIRAHHIKGEPDRWLAAQQGWDNIAFAAVNAIDNADLGYNVTRDKYFYGWSDIYYIPRRFFRQFIELAQIMGDHHVFQEVAIPTIMRLIDDTCRKHPDEPTISSLTKCWGGCCSYSPNIDDVLSYPCGHAMNLQNTAITDAFFTKLDRDAELLGQPINKINGVTERS